MNRHSDDPLLAFDNIWVHSKQTSAHDSINRALTPQAIYQRWSSKWQRKSAIDKDLLTHDRALIQGANGTLHSGQLTVLTGTSGSGKSVLLRALAGLMPMSTGDVHLFDKTTTGSRSDSIHTCAPIAWRGQVALLAQHPQLVEGSVLENLQIPYRLQAHHTHTFDREWHVTQLAYLGKDVDFLQQSAYHLSGGERQLVNTLRLLQLQPRVLLLDEPTAALDSDSSAQLIQLLVRWLQADTRRTLLWVTHDTTDIMPLANKHWRMQEGVLTDVSYTTSIT